MAVICPRCEQSFVSKVRIVPLDTIVYLCEECDALWTTDRAIQQSNFVDFSEYMRGYGYIGDWQLVENADDVLTTDC